MARSKPFNATTPGKTLRMPLNSIIFFFSIWASLFDDTDLISVDGQGDSGNQYDTIHGALHIGIDLHKDQSIVQSNDNDRTDHSIQGSSDTTGQGYPSNRNCSHSREQQ